MKVLLVEDNAALAEDLAEIFQDLGHDVTWVANAADARLAARRGVDVAIVDLHLPDQPGINLLPDLREASADAEVIVTTGDADVESAIAAVRAGAFAYLVKPVAARQMVMTLERALERVQLRRQAAALQAELAESERRYRDIFDSAQVLILVLDDRFCIRLANATVEAVTGYSRDELRGKDFIAALCPPGTESAWRQRLAFGEDGGEHEAELRARDGSNRLVRFRWVRREERSESIQLGIGLDVTQTRRLERAARTAEKLAAVGTLTAGLAHEIRNPLNAALLQLTLAERRLARFPQPERAAAVEPLARIRDELERLTHLLTDFLAFARPRPPARESVDLSRVVDEVITIHQPVAAAVERSLGAEIVPGLCVQGDRDQLKGVVVNLTKNALEACARAILVRLEPRGPDVILTITDDGPGIPEEQRGRLFEPFFTTKEKGTGLGLALCYGAITAHGGEITLTDRADGGGAVAQVRLPREAGVPAP